MIDWFAFVIVAFAAAVSTVVLVGFYSLGIKLLSIPARTTAGEGAAEKLSRDDETDDVAGENRPRLATIGAYTCFTLCGIGVLYGIYLIVPALHGG